MKILSQPHADPHDCGKELWDLHDRPIDTIVACRCGKRWQCVAASFFLYLTWRTLHPVGHNRLKLWMYHSRQKAVSTRG